ncbi:hypothetical protein [Streptomyces chryseus]
MTAYPTALPTPGAVASCRICEAYPVIDVAVRAHQGLLLMMRFHKLDGPFCRSCGTAIMRALTTRTLWQGWWSPLSLLVFAPVALAWNLIALRRFSSLPEPVPMPGRQPLAQGTPVHRRPLAYVALIPFAWAVWITALILTHAT